MIDTRIAFEQRFRQLLEWLYGSGAHGYSTAELQSAEDRLGVKLPEVFLRCMEIAGRHRGMTRALENLRPLDELELRLYDGEECLAFSEENQGVTVSLIRLADLAAADPPVFACSPDGGKLVLQDDLLSGFLLRTLLWNSIEVQSMTSAGDFEGTLGPDELEQLRGRMGSIDCGPSGGWGLEALRWRSCLACIYPDPSDARGELRFNMSGYCMEEQDLEQLVEGLKFLQ